jgi:hypothetical protein
MILANQDFYLDAGFYLDASDDPWVWTPSAVSAELNRILAVIDSVNMDVSNATKVGKITSAEWNTWYQVYLAAHNFLTSASSLWGSNVMTARQHEAEAAKWRDLVKKRGAAVQGPENLIRRDPESGFNYWTAALVVSGAVAAVVGYRAFQKYLLTRATAKVTGE